MAGRSTVVADTEQRGALAELARSRDRAEADRARCILLTLSGWSSPRLAEAFGVREDTVRLWRMVFKPSITRSPISTRSAIAIRWIAYESLLRPDVRLR
jgi:hypothetical protein